MCWLGLPRTFMSPLGGLAACRGGPLAWTPAGTWQLPEFPTCSPLSLPEELGRGLLQPTLCQPGSQLFPGGAGRSSASRPRGRPQTQILCLRPNWLVHPMTLRKSGRFQALCPH